MSDDPPDPHAFAAELMSAAAVDGEDDSTIALLERLCRAAGAHLEAGGVAVGLMSELGSAGVVAGADARSLELDELQFSLGEGPGCDAFTLRRPVLISDLGSADGRAWPAFTTTVRGHGVGGVYAIPLHVGAFGFGVLTIYTDEGMPLDPDRIPMALTFAEVATELLLADDSTAPSGALHPGAERALSHRVEIYQAQGSVMVQLGVSLAEALVRMRAHAFAHDLSLAELSALIMSGDVVLSP